jgi:hypothetical protein
VRHNLLDAVISETVERRLGQGVQRDQLSLGQLHVVRQLPRGGLRAKTCTKA